MFSQNPFAGLALEPLFDSVLPDFVLAFTFFTALCYAVLGRHFGRKRPAVAMSVALGVAVCWPDLLRDWSQVQAVEVELAGRRYRLRTDLRGAAGQAFAAAGDEGNAVQLADSPRRRKRRPLS